MRHASRAPSFTALVGVLKCPTVQRIKVYLNFMQVEGTA